jgi:hypothetical protein
MDLHSSRGIRTASVGSVAGKRVVRGPKSENIRVPCENIKVPSANMRARCGNIWIVQSNIGIGRMNEWIVHVNIGIGLANI